MHTSPIPPSRRESVDVTFGGSQLDHLERRGWVVLGGLSPDQAERQVERMGVLVNQSNGQVRYAVAPEQPNSKLRFSKGRRCIGPHTEVPTRRVPPHYLALYCNSPASCGGGQTVLSDTHPMLEELGHSELTLLEREAVHFHAEHIIADGRTRAVHPILTRHQNGSTIFRFSHNMFYFGDINAASGDDAPDRPPFLPADLQPVAAWIVDYHERRSTELLLAAGELLIWDNHRLIHSRRAFRDNSRHLTRYWIDRP